MNEGISVNALSEVESQLRALLVQLEGNTPGIEDVRTALSQSETRAKLAEHLELVFQWNTKVDLISPAPVSVAVSRHVIDSVACALLVGQAFQGSLRSFVDIGSGAGFPGIVFSILYSELPGVLVEPREKRAVFLKEVKRRLKLERVYVSHSRVEDATIDQLSSPSLYLVRALSGDELTPELLHPILVKNPGPICRMVSAQWDSNSPAPWPKPERVIDYQLPLDGTKRRLAIWECFT